MMRSLSGLAGACAALAAAAVIGAPAALAQDTARAAPVDPLPPTRPQPAQDAQIAAAVAPGTGSWTPVTNVPLGFSPGSLLLQDDGSVLVHRDNHSTWYRLTPDRKGNYATGTWTPIASTSWAPLYYASAVLPDGRTVVIGGEYDAGLPVWTTTGQIYDPDTNTWSSLPAPPGWTNVGDASSTMLPNGTLMLGGCCNSEQALLNAADKTWTITGAGKSRPNEEESWTLLPNGTVMTVNVLGFDNTAEAYSPSTGRWSRLRATPDRLNAGGEIGPAPLTPSGKVFAFGANGNNDTYDTATGTWSSGVSFPRDCDGQCAMADAPAAVLPDGHVLAAASPFFFDPTRFFDYDGTTLTRVADPPAGATTFATFPSFAGSMLVLPTGQILETGSGLMNIYTDPGSPDPAWRPVITSVPHVLTRGATYTVSGIQLSGLTEGAYYGDDNQSASNYPLVRIINGDTGDVYYAKTFNPTSYSVAPGTPSSASFTVPADIPPGAAKLEVVANGIASAPSPVTVRGKPL
jgi:hypothetical protein